MEDLTELTKAIKGYNWSKNGAVLLAIDAEIRKVAGHPEHVARLESALLDVLRSDATIAAKRGVCKRLGLIAGERSVPVLAAMLLQPETSDMARYSLERMPLPSVDAALRNALGRTAGLVRVGVIHSIGNRKDDRAVPALGDLLRDGDEAVAAAAAWALGRIGGAEAIRHLASHRNSARSRFRQEVLDAYLICARRLASEGRKNEAKAMFKELSTDGMPSPVRRAAAVGLKSV